jgi:hypothetical protein
LFPPMAEIMERPMAFGIMKAIPILALTLLGLSGAGHASDPSPTILDVDLMDPSTSPSIKSMTIKTDAQSVTAGPVVFSVTNDSKDLV